MAALYGKPKQEREVFSQPNHNESLAVKDHNLPSLIQEYIELQEVQKKSGYDFNAKTQVQAEQCRTVADTLEKTAYKISQNLELINAAKTYSPDLHEDIQLRTKLYEDELKHRLTKGKGLKL